MTTLTTPIQIGPLTLSHRVVMAPLTRNRASSSHTPTPLMRQYYAQRATITGTLLISEGTFISARAGGIAHVPGIYTPSQIKEWKAITDAVHARGSYIFCQLWALGRAADPGILAREGEGFDVISSGDIPIPVNGAGGAAGGGNAVPRPLSEEEIASWIEDYATAAKNAIEAGFDGVEIHGANGYLCDQFLQSGCNNREDGWGGSVANRARFGLEVARAVCEAIGAERTGYRVSPWSRFQGMRVEKEEEMREQFGYLVDGLGKLGVAYVHVVEPRISGARTVDEHTGEEERGWLLDAFKGEGAVILAGGFSASSADEAIRKHHGHRVAIGFGRHFIANPDLPLRLARGLELNPYDRDSFYTPESPVGYVDYPLSEELAASSLEKGALLK